MPLDRATVAVRANPELSARSADSMLPVAEGLEWAQTQVLWSRAVSRALLRLRKLPQRILRRHRSQLTRNPSRFCSSPALTTRMKREKCVLKVKCCFAFCSHQLAQRAFSK